VTFVGGRYRAELLRGHRRLVAAFVLTSVGRSALLAAAMLLIREFLARALGGTATLGGLAALLAAAFVGAGVLSYHNAVIQQRMVKILELGMMERLVRHLLSLSVSALDRQSHGDVIQAVRQDVSDLRAVVISLAKLFLESVTALGLLASAAWLGPRLAMLALVVVPLAALPLYAIARRTLERSYAVRTSGYVLFDLILQMLRGVRVIKAYRGERAEARGAIEQGRRYFDETIEMVRVRSLSQVVLESVAGAVIVVVVVAGGLQVMRGELTWPELLAFLLAVRALQGPLNNVNGAYMEMKSRGAAVSRISELLAARTDVPDAADAEPLPNAPAEIAFDGVSFAHRDGRLVLHDLSFVVRAGETIGVAGPSGAGKSTLLDLFARFHDATGGAVRFDGRDVRTIRLADVYEKLAIVTQTPFLFSASVRDNVRCGRPDAGDAEVEAAAAAADVHAEILALPNGYDTVVGAGGRELSVGQAQRVSIARALLKRAPVLLLDEATSSLDSRAEARVHAAIARVMAGRTTVIVAHRLSTLLGADRILVLDAGRAVAFAPHDVLLRECPLYAELWARQSTAPLPTGPTGRAAEDVAVEP
jgi:subfamily B ATP-binding cassette protein MsbA